MSVCFAYFSTHDAIAKIKPRGYNRIYSIEMKHNLLPYIYITLHEIEMQINDRVSRHSIKASLC